MMDIDEDEILRNIAAGGSMDYSVWPALLPRVIAHIEQIAYEEFPIPDLPPPPPPPQPPATIATIPSSIPQAPDSELSDHFLAPLPSSPTEPPTASSSSPPDENKENTPIAQIGAAPPPPPPPATPLPPTSASVTSAPLPPGTLPPQIALMLSEIISYLISTFPTYPPHTVQRISELVVAPKRHYRSLATYLHALDRVVRVTSGLNIYPLPSTHAEIPGGGLANGVLEAAARPSPWASPGSDEALGGALLTPIPWLQHNHQPVTGSLAQSAQPQPQQPQVPTPPAQEAPGEFEGEVRTESTETIDGPNGVGSIETVSVSVNGIPSMGARGVGVTQGELLRQEQRAGVVPVSQLVPSHHVHQGSNASAVAQQQIQALIHHHRALAQSQIQARAPSSSELPDSPSSAPNTTSTPSSATLDEEGEDAAADNIAVTVISIHSNNAEDEDKPHARGPEEIGVSDLGLQSATTSTTAGGMMHGIDVQAAVGRKPPDISASSNSEAETAGDKDNDKMDIEDDGQEEQASTPKRDAEHQLEGSASKKMKEDSSLVSGESGDAHPKSTDAEPVILESDQGEAMDRD